MTHEAAIRLCEIGIRNLLIVNLATIERGQLVITLDFTTLKDAFGRIQEL